MSADPTLEFLTSELSSEDPSKCVECISRLQVVALSLGAEKTVSLLIPYLAAQTENVRRRLEPPPKITRSAAPRPAPPLRAHRSLSRARSLQFSDEVLVTVAEVLPFLVDMVGDCEPAGTPGGKAAILNLLGDLCHQEETTVRDQAVASLNKIGATLSAKDVQTLVVPIALKLARTLEWFTPRVSACGLFALSFKAVADDASAAALRGELRETFKALGIDDAPMVRRSTAGRLAEFAEVLSESMVIEDLLPRYFTLCTHEQDSVPMRPKRPHPPGPRFPPSARGDLQESERQDLLPLPRPLLVRQQMLGLQPELVEGLLRHLLRRQIRSPLWWCSRHLRCGASFL